MAVDEQQLKKLGDQFGDLAPLISLEWRLRATADAEPTREYLRSRPLLSRSYNIDLVSGQATHRLHGWGQTNSDGIAEVFITDFMRAEDFQLNEPTDVSFVAVAENGEPVVLTYTVDERDVAAAPEEIATHYTVTVRSWGLDGSRKSTAFSWHATVDVSVDSSLIGG